MKFSDAAFELNNMEFREGSIYSVIIKLILEKEIIQSPISSEELSEKLKNATLKKIPPSVIATYMKPFVAKGIVKTEKINNKRIWFGSWTTLEKSTKETYFPIPDTLIEKLGRKFEKDFIDLRLVCNRSGNCSAFLVRKIIEKLIYYTFAKQRMIDKLKVSSGENKFLGLDKMLDIASTTNGLDGTPFLLPKTIEHLKRIKFIGDSAAHDFLSDVYPEQVNNDMNYIINAIDQLSKKL